MEIFVELCDPPISESYVQKLKESGIIQAVSKLTVFVNV